MYGRGLVIELLPDTNKDNWQKIKEFYPSKPNNPTSRNGLQNNVLIGITPKKRRKRALIKMIRSELKEKQFVRFDIE
jgi:hypothetical protein